jgi:hypothetical protein
LQDIASLKHYRDKLSMSIKRAEDENQTNKDEILKQVTEY